MIDAVLSPHSPLTCGTAKWSKRLADRLGVPFYQDWGRHGNHPLMSARLSELPQVELPKPYDLFVHDVVSGYSDLILDAQTIYAANREIAQQLRRYRQDIIEAWAPSSLEGNADRTGYRVLTFGMAHKIHRDRYLNLKATLEREHPNYIICWTCAVHEGRPWENDFTKAEAALRSVFGERLRVLGSLADDGLARELQECDAVALFFESGVRENNTTAWAALEAGKPLITNTDNQSPPLDVKHYSWDALLQLMGVSVPV